MTKRSFIIGDEWLYYKIYSGPKTSDLILTEVIKPIAESLLKEKIIDKWFYIRYSDPKNHLRLRLHYKDSESVSKIINSFHAHFNKYSFEDLIWKIQTDTYHRELERYGRNTMELSETLFYYDSKAISDFLSLIEGDEGEELRWLFGLRMVDTLLECFSYTLENKIYLVEFLKTRFGNEFGMNRFLKKQLDDKYRQKRKKIENFMFCDKKEIEEYIPILKILSNYKVFISPIAQSLHHIKAAEKLEIELENLLSSYIHMTLNRLFRSKNRLHELVCYDFLYRHYTSVLARNKKKRLVENAKISPL